MSFVGIIFLILLAKEILVFNAESLILLCFVLFIGAMTHYLRDSVIQSFEERSQNLEKSYYAQRKNLESYLLALRNQLEREKEILDKDLSTYLPFFYAARWAMVARARWNLRLRVQNHLLEKLKRLAALEARSLEEVQHELATQIPAAVRANFYQKSKSVKESILVGSINQLRSN